MYDEQKRSEADERSSAKYRGAHVFFTSGDLFIASENKKTCVLEDRFCKEGRGIGRARELRS